MIYKLIGILQKKLASNDLIIRILLKLKNQINEVIKLSQNDGAEMSNNGEALIMSSVASKINSFVDVGANLGIWTEKILELNKSLNGILFEPSPKCFEKLNQNFEKNKSIIIIDVALSDKSEKKHFFLENDFGESSSLVKFDNVIYNQDILLEVSTLDLEMSKLNITSIDFLKIDAEGFDLRVIKGAIELIKKNKIKIIQFEYNYTWLYAGSTLFEAIEILDSNNYKVFQLRYDGLYIYDYNRFGDFFGYSNFIAVSTNSIDLISNIIKTKK